MDVTCKQWYEYTDSADLPQLISQLRGERFLSIGSGSNLLFLGDYPGALLHSRILDMESSPDGTGSVLIRVGAGVEMDYLIAHTCQCGLWGLENLSGIPGEVGASAVQNVGAYGVEAKDVIKEVECFDTLSGEYVRFTNAGCRFGYRMSLFKQPEYKGRYIVTHVTFELSSKPKPILNYGHLCRQVELVLELTPQRLRDIVIGIRNQKLPSVEKIGSAGSFFKNPVISEEDYRRFCEAASDVCATEPPHYPVADGIKLSAAWLIDKAGMKGVEVGNVATWQEQPLVIVNLTGKARPDEIVALEQRIIARVKDIFGVELSPEVEHIYSSSAI